MMETAIRDGRALKKLAEFVRAQGGDDAYVSDPSKFPKAPVVVPVIAEKSGYVTRILAEKIGAACMMLGGGRMTKDAQIDRSVGIRLQKKNADVVKKGDTLACLYAASEKELDNVIQNIKTAYEIGSERPARTDVVKKIITDDTISE